ncbi:MAG: adenosylmethionine--8-amino-7-oxononanoate transaminase [Desulfatitalea sp.]|nr:adenosylmethionine--8-amino-7-oxononanoate transaminase [Desulfatitalea sp.]
MTPLSTETSLELDRRHVWHPYASMIDPPPVLPVAAAGGVRLRLEDGRELIDGMSSWWAAIHGYNHPDLNAAITEQTAAMAHVMFGGLTHRPAVSLASLLVEIAPAGLASVFFCDSGSVSVEVAIKMALQYWIALGKAQKNRLLTIRGGYHGDTFGAMAVCDPVTGMHGMFRSHLTPHLFADRPTCRFEGPWAESDLESFRKLIADHHDQLAALILEPILQGAGGMWAYHPEYLRGVRRLCDRYGVLLILDEIATGFGRTGRLFASEHADVRPDILCLGKALTGGYLSLAATLSTRQVSETICAGSAGVFMHGPTFMANPLACAVALASVKLLLASEWQGRIRELEAQMARELAPCRDLRQVADVRTLGAVGVVELHRPVNMRAITRRFVQRGVWLRPFGRLVYIMPPYIITAGELTRLTTAMVETIAEEQEPTA